MAAHVWGMLFGQKIISPALTWYRFPQISASIVPWSTKKTFSDHLWVW